MYSLLNKNKKDFELIFYVPDDQVERKAKELVYTIFNRTIYEKYKDLLYMLFKEISNYYSSMNVIYVISGQHENETKVSMLLNERFLGYAREKLRLKNIFISFSLLPDEQKIEVKVFNNKSIPKEHERRIRTLFQKFQETPNTSEFSDYPHTPEIYFSMVCRYVTAMNVDLKYLRFSNKEETSYVKLELPLSNSYVSEREMYKKVNSRK